MTPNSTWRAQRSVGGVARVERHEALDDVFLLLCVCPPQVQTRSVRSDRHAGSCAARLQTPVDHAEGRAGRENGVQSVPQSDAVQALCALEPTRLPWAVFKQSSVYAGPPRRLDKLRTL